MDLEDILIAAGSFTLGFLTSKVRTQAKLQEMQALEAHQRMQRLEQELNYLKSITNQTKGPTD